MRTAPLHRHQQPLESQLGVGNVGVEVEQRRVVESVDEGHILSVGTVDVAVLSNNEAALFHQSFTWRAVHDRSVNVKEQQASVGLITSLSERYTI